MANTSNFPPTGVLVIQQLATSLEHARAYLDAYMAGDAWCLDVARLSVVIQGIENALKCAAPFLDVE